MNNEKDILEMIREEKAGIDLPKKKGFWTRLFSDDTFLDPEIKSLIQKETEEHVKTGKISPTVANELMSLPDNKIVTVFDKMNAMIKKYPDNKLILFLSKNRR